MQPLSVPYWIGGVIIAVKRLVVGIVKSRVTGKRGLYGSVGDCQVHRGSLKNSPEIRFLHSPPFWGQRLEAVNFDQSWPRYQESGGDYD